MSTITVKTTQLYLIGNAHIDPVWLWRWPEGHHEVHATFRSALDRLNEYPDFVFVSSSAQFYQWVERSDPAMFAEIKQRVSEGRWEIVGGWWIQPDCNLPGGEAFVRQALYAQRYFLDKFGVTARTGYSVDAFGHNAVLPQLLAKSGLENYVFARPALTDLDLPGRLFWWQAADGSRVLAQRLIYGYNASRNLEAHVQRSAADLRPPVAALMCFFGVGNHGGGPTRANIETMERLQADPALPELIFSTPDRYFDAMRALNMPLPTHAAEIQRTYGGCYSAHSGVKQWNRQAEQRLLTAEKWATIAARVLDRPYPAAELARAWQLVLFNQFHDILAGTSISSAYADARDTYGEALAIAGRALAEATEALSWSLHLEADEATRPFVVFNHQAWASRAPVEVEFDVPVGDQVILDAEGVVAPHQLIAAESASALRWRVVFLADLPPLGYAVYRLAPRPAGQPVPTARPPLAASATVLANDSLRLEFEPATGAIARLYDQRRSRDAFSGPAARAEVVTDRTSTWGLAELHLDQTAGVFAAPSYRLVENGPVRAAVRVETTYGRSRLTQTFTLYRELARVEVAVTVDWHEQFAALKLRFPVNVDDPAVTSEAPYGTVTRPATGQEAPGQTWVDVSGPAGAAEWGLSLANDAKYAYSAQGAELGLTVLRSPVFANLTPLPPETDPDQHFMDQGRQSFRYSLLPHTAGWRTAGTVATAAELNAPPLVVPATFHAGPLPLRASFVEVEAEGEGVTLTALKPAEDSTGDLIVRAVNLAGEPVEAALHLNAWRRAIRSEFGPAEIKTFRVPASLAHPAVENNLIEFGA
ncbi:MAG: alpha-mannosidase [Anaerolineales bacterium]|nr:alpha-mannosidase [Anaerolineales bacterium]